MYIHNVYSGKCYPMYINALQCIYPMYIDVTQCITPNVYSCQYTLGIYIVLQFFWRPYIHWVTVYTLWCRLIFVTQCIYCVTQCIYGIYIGTHVYTLWHTYIHLVTCIYIGLHAFIYIVLHWRRAYTLGNMWYIHCSTFHTCSVFVTQCISRCSPMYILLGFLCWVIHCVTWCIYIGVHCPLYTLYYTGYIHCVASGIYIVLHWTEYTLCCMCYIHCIA